MIKKPYLLTPGPTPVPERVAAVASLPLFHHRTAEFSRIYHEVSSGLQEIFATKQEVFILAASGTGAMEAAVVNTISPGDEVFVLNAGKFSARWAEITRAHGANVCEETIPWGADFPSDRLAEVLRQQPGIRAVFVTLSETSSGALYDIQGFGRVLREHEAILVVDGISGLAATECRMDDWQVDVLVGSSQKALMTPPGLAYIALSAKAWARQEKSKAAKYYFDLKKYREKLKKETCPFTPAISLIRQQHEALNFIREIGWKNLLIHHRVLAEATRAGVLAMGLSLLAKNPVNSLTAVCVPAGLDGNVLVRTLQSKYNTHVANAQEPHKGEFFRIGHLGYTGGFEILAAISALEMTLQDMGFALTNGRGITATQKVLQEHWQ